MVAAPLRSALGAAARGYPVILMRITAGGKFPALPSAHPDGDPMRGRCRGECGRLGHGIYDATCDEGRLLEMLRLSRHPTGYAIACGVEPHNILGLDLDRKDGLDGVERLADVAEVVGFELPPTIEVATPSGGLHRWYGMPPSVHVPNAVGRIGAIRAPGVDIRSRGGQLVGPGSRGPHGAYQLISDPDTPLAPCPPPLLTLLIPAPRPAYAEPRGPVRPSKRIAGLIATVLDAKPGRRNDSLFWASCRMAEVVAEGRISETEARELLLTAADRIGLEYSEACSCIDSGLRT